MAAGTGRSNAARGQWGERRAAAHFERLGFSVLARDWRPHGYGVRGDVDLIVQRDDLVVFCEVKARRGGAPGGAVAAVTPAKQSQVRRLAELWLAERGGPDVRVRFDVVALDGVRLAHYDGAF